ncbi:MAG: S9 family peptidase [Opitutaceae bacterium]|nr:S9 family peptidase [Opitutaceae bacterium]
MDSWKRITFLYLMLWGCLPGPADARSITPEDLWRLPRVAELKVAPDGILACYTLQRWSLETNAANTQLWLLDTSTGATRQLAEMDSSGSLSPAWSPDGRMIAFVGKTPAIQSSALFVTTVDDGKIREIVSPPLGAFFPQWMPDGKSLIFITSVIPEITPAVNSETWVKTGIALAHRKSSKTQVHIAEGGFYRMGGTWLTDSLAHRLVRISLAEGSLTDLTPGYPRLFSPRGPSPFAVSPDGRSLAVSMNSLPQSVADENEDIMLVATDGSGARRNLTEDNPGRDIAPCFSPDGSMILFGRRVRRIYAGENTKLFSHDLSTGTNNPLRPSVDLSFSSWHFAPAGKTILAVAEKAGVTPAFRIPVGGSTLEKLTPDGTASDPQQLANGRVIMIHEAMRKPPEVVLLGRNGADVAPPHPLTTTSHERFDWGHVESHHYSGAHGDPVQLWLVFPSNYDPQGKYPLIHLLHGGPNTMAGDAFSFLWNAQVFAARGAIVAMVNRHGSTGFGEAFASSVNGNWSDLAVADIIGATDFLLSRVPSIDPARVAACGVSYGGYLAICLAGRTDRFACLISHAGISDFYTQYGSDLAPHLAQTMGGFPWKDQERFAWGNPVTHAAHFRTPMLILQGGRDSRVPDGNALALYGILQQMGVASRLVYFPDEGHWVQSPGNSLLWYHEVFQWLDRWMAKK